MIRYIREHLAVKVFLINIVLLMFIGCLVFGMIALMIPNSYLKELAYSQDSEIQKIIPSLEQMSLSDGFEMLERFAIEYSVEISLKDGDGNGIRSFGGISISLAPDADGIDIWASKGISKVYSVKFLEGNTYQMYVFGDKEQANLPLMALIKQLPWLAAVTLIISLLIARLYTNYITKPILKVSSLSRELSELNFNIHYKNNRVDEIGILSENLEELSERLNNALSELQEANLALKKEIDREQKLEQQQLSFFSAVSHELKTPVTVLKGQLEGMICNVGGYKDREKYLRKSHQIICSMEGLINEILSVSHLKSSFYSLKIEEVELNQMIRKVVSEREELAVEKNIEIRIETDGMAQIHVDEKIFQKVLSNIIGNAINYTPESGKIWIRLKKEKEGILLTVENVSRQIPEEEISKLFEAFYRRDKSRSRATGGSGLGLYIVKTILEDHQFLFKFENTGNGVEINIWCK